MIDNPSFEESSDPEDVWSNWRDCANDFVQDEGTLIVKVRLEPERGGHDTIGFVPIFADGWTVIGMSWSPTGKFTTYVNSKRRPWWAIGLLYSLWYRRVTRCCKSD